MRGTSHLHLLPASRCTCLQDKGDSTATILDRDERVSLFYLVKNLPFIIIRVNERA